MDGNTTALTQAEALARIRLIRTERVGPITFQQLIARHGTAIAALDALPELAKQGGRQKPLKLPTIAAIKDEAAKLRDMGGKFLFSDQPNYPRRLAAIDDAPPVLAVLGNEHVLGDDIIGIVGPRNASANGIMLTKRLSEQLSDAGVVTASGMARGIDTAAHVASLAGGTIACVAGGVDVIYPKENADLYAEIQKTGCIISEVPLGVQPTARHFPRRNRLISGLSLGVLVAEAAPKSGSLITARLAAEQGREVFAIPGSPLDPRAQGANQLLRDGAILVQSAADILAELAELRRRPLREPDHLPLFAAAPETPPSIDSDLIARLNSLLSPTPVAIDDLVRLTNAPAGSVQAALLSLELAGVAERLPGGRIVQVAV